MKKLLNTFLMLSLVMPVHLSSAADQTSQQDWKNLMTHQMRLTLAMHYSFLSTDTSNLMIAIAYKTRDRNHRLAALERQTLGTANLFSSTGDTDSRPYWTANRKKTYKSWSALLLAGLVSASWIRCRRTESLIMQTSSR